MKILITGGCGHLGSFLIRKLSENHECIVVDDLSTQRFCSLFNLKNKIKFLNKDIDDIDFFDLKNIDIVIHLAAVTDAANSFKNKEELESVNIQKTKKLIDKCSLSSIKKFIFPSSTSVYGVASDIVTEDNDEYINPQSPYANSKIQIENYLKEKYKFPYIIFRFGTIFGNSEGMRFHTAINKFCYEVSLGLPITVWKENYEQYRPYLGLEDMYKSIDLFINNDIINQTYNVVSENLKLSDIVSFISEKNNISINFVDTPLLNQFSYNVDFSKIKNNGYNPTCKVKDSIYETLELLKNLK